MVSQHQNIVGNIHLLTHYQRNTGHIRLYDNGQQTSNIARNTDHSTSSWSIFAGSNLQNQNKHYRYRRIEAYFSSGDPFNKTHGFWFCMYWFPWREIFRINLMPSRSLHLTKAALYELSSRAIRASKVKSSVIRFMAGIRLSKYFSVNIRALKQIYSLPPPKCKL